MATTVDTVRGASTDGGQTIEPGPDLAPIDHRIFVVAVALFIVLMGFSGRYGFHRDELYFLDCARHLAASYVDQPVLTPLIARLSLWAFGYR